MRNEVLQFLKNLPASESDKFNKAFLLLRNTKGANQNQVRVYNMQGASPQNIKNILYDLKKLHGISDAEILSKRNTVEKSPVEKAVEELTNTVNTTLVVDNKAVEEVTNTVNTTLVDQNTAVLPVQEDKKTDLHKEFPFLSAADCPAELHIVTGQLVASWKRYNTMHAELQLVTSGEKELSEEDKNQLTADCNAAFQLNDKLYKELEHYRDNNTILGEAEALKEYTIKHEIDAMTTEELVKYKNNSAPYLSRAKNALLKDKLTEEKKKEISDRIADRELRLQLVNKKLGM